MLPPKDLSALAEFSTIPPAVPPAALALKSILPSKVWTVVDEAWVIFPRPLIEIAEPDRVDVRLVLMSTSPPYSVMGPFAETAVFTDSSALFPDFPRVKPPTVWLFWLRGNQLVYTG